MRVRIVRPPTGTIDGIALDEFHVGAVYELGSQLGCLFLAEGWAEPVSSDSEQAVRPPPAEVDGPVVLVIDDDPELRRLVSRLLEGHGYRIVTAAHGEEALHRLPECCPDLIVLDLHMPVMDGWEFLSARKRLASQLAAVPVLLLSGSRDKAACEHAKADAVAFIPKPFDPEHLLRAVHAASGRGASL